MGKTKPADILSNLRTDIAMTSKICKHCGIEKNYSEFSRQPDTRDGLHCWCRACKNENAKEWQKNNAERSREKNNFWNANHKDKINGWHKEYYESHKKEHLIRVHRRLARVRGANGNGVSVKEWDTVLAMYNHSCLSCGSKEKMTMDHVIPLFCGGEHDISNIQPLCMSCNCSKGTKTIDYRQTIP